MDCATPGSSFGCSVVEWDGWPGWGLFSPQQGVHTGIARPGFSWRLVIFKNCPV